MIVGEFPSDEESADHLRARELSNEIRSDRARDLPLPVTLNGRDLLITFWPIAELHGATVAPFTHTAGSIVTSGHLYLRRRGQVLPIAVSAAVEGQTLKDLWLSVLDGFSYLTCLPQSGDAHEPVKGNGDETLAVAVASVVAGHRRRLQPGQHHHLEAERLARSIGVQLAEDETWVRSHVRGNPDDEPIVVHWRQSGPD